MRCTLRSRLLPSEHGGDYADNGQPLPLPYNPQNRREQYIPSGFTIGCSYTFKTGSIFYTFNTHSMVLTFFVMNETSSLLSVFLDKQTLT
ncbi:hypothetical protein BT96DRAFT_1092703 [Gymnopus androsaceus JB14]|uniref:Uncharacterized protein n=1 Tax=Gymnopus androsaceus JB14 TaxID=1447944 RepID=A0A6A4GHW8_9AGAR|nr:hypothetical protein BT96DRAFT_1092703 [Gymnopus androsaceus JB14]